MKWRGNEKIVLTGTLRSGHDAGNRPHDSEQIVEGAAVAEWLDFSLF